MDFVHLILLMLLKYPMDIITIYIRAREVNIRFIRTKRNEVGHFFRREGTVIGFAKAGTDFFANIMYVEENPVTFDVENISYDIVRINLATEGFEVLLWRIVLRALM